MRIVLKLHVMTEDRNLAFFMNGLDGIGIMKRGSRAISPDGRKWEMLANYAGGKQSPGGDCRSILSDHSLPLACFSCSSATSGRLCCSSFPTSERISGC